MSGKNSALYKFSTLKFVLRYACWTVLHNLLFLVTLFSFNLKIIYVYAKIICMYIIYKLYIVYKHIHVYVCIYMCLTLCDLVNCSPPGFSVLGIFQARILEQVAMSFSQPRDLPWIFLIQGSNLHLCISCIGRKVLYQLSHLGSSYVIEEKLNVHSSPSSCLLDLNPIYQS